jgi:hypothetical protein
MNKQTIEAYHFFTGDPEAAFMAEKMILSGKPPSIIGEWLEEYVTQLSVLDLIRIYKELLVPATEATDWTGLANRLMVERFDACGYEAIAADFEVIDESN